MSLKHQEYFLTFKGQHAGLSVQSYAITKLLRNMQGQILLSVTLTQLRRTTQVLHKADREQELGPLKNFWGLMV